MSPSSLRRVIIVLLSVGGGSVLSYGIYKLRRGGGELTTQDTHSLLTNIVFSVGIILGLDLCFCGGRRKVLIIECSDCFNPR
ncbi:MAG: hypothetical protein IPM91_03440 [Bacteroidetes bacterium]|nr:hypothetical protein [Bacteroidota bacterium]